MRRRLLVMPRDGLLDAREVAPEEVAGEDLAAQEAVGHQQRIAGELLVAHDREQGGPLHQLPVDLHPGWADGAAVVVGADHGAELGQLPHPQVGHHPAQGRAGGAAGVELGVAEGRDPGRGRDRLQAVFVVVRVHHPHQLHQEGVELDAGVAAVRADQRHRGRAAGLDGPHVPGQRANLRAQLVQHRAVLRDALGDLGLQEVVAVGVDHGGTCPISRFSIQPCQEDTAPDDAVVVVRGQ
jgi:hypothetical protein